MMDLYLDFIVTAPKYQKYKRKLLGYLDHKDWELTYFPI